MKQEAPRSRKVKVDRYCMYCPYKDRKPFRNQIDRTGKKIVVYKCLKHDIVIGPHSIICEDGYDNLRKVYHGRVGSVWQEV